MIPRKTSALSARHVTTRLTRDIERTKAARCLLGQAFVQRSYAAACLFTTARSAVSAEERARTSEATQMMKQATLTSKRLRLLRLIARNSFVAISMDGNVLKEARRKKHWTQEQAALELDVTQAYLSMLEKGRRPLSERFVRKALKVLNFPPTALPLRSRQAVMPVSFQMRDFSAELGALGYPEFSYLRVRRPRNPAEVLLEALNQANLDSRVAEGLPWLALTYVDMDWDWLVRNAKLRDRQNRLGFALALASEVAVGKNDGERENTLRQHVEVLENSRLAREDTFCHDSMTRAERVWLQHTGISSQT
jgi:transcriptional regulator with XRE-family HTH domain